MNTAVLCLETHSEGHGKAHSERHSEAHRERHSEAHSERHSEAHSHTRSQAKAVRGTNRERDTVREIHSERHKHTVLSVVVCAGAAPLLGKQHGPTKQRRQLLVKYTCARGAAGAACVRIAFA